MEYLKELVLIIYIGYCVDEILMQDYRRQPNFPLYQVQCKETLVSSLLQCAAFGRASQDVRFFFNMNNYNCRWNCIIMFTGSTVMGEGWHHYAVESKMNLALLKPSSASSFNENNPSKWGAHFATDGLKPISSVNIFASTYEQSPWLMVTLHELTTIYCVRLFNRRDGGGERFHDVAFEVSSDGSNFEQKGFFKGPGMTNQVIEILFDHPTIGKCVRIKITQGTSNILNFVEFEIYAFE